MDGKINCSKLYNEAEQLFYQNCKNPPKQLTINHFNSFISKKIPSAIYSDVIKLYPDLYERPLSDVIILSQQCSSADGLQKAQITGVFNELMLETEYLIALTTIWTASYVELKKQTSRSSVRFLREKQKIFQTGLLRYYFNIILNYSVILARLIGDNIHSRSGPVHGRNLYEWLSGTSEGLDALRITVLMDFLHKCSLQIKSPQRIIDLSVIK